MKALKTYKLSDVLEVEHGSDCSLAAEARKHNGISFPMAKSHLERDSHIDSAGQIWQKSQISPLNINALDAFISCEYMNERYKNDELTFAAGDLVTKKGGSEWQGRVVGFYSTILTPEGYAVESWSHAGSVQIYPVAVLEGVV